MNKIKKLIIVDLECTCWDGDMTRPEFYEKSEIIEFGLTLMDIKTEEILDNRSIYVKPVMPHNLILSDYCVKLTGITDHVIKKQGIPLKEALAQIRNKYPITQPWFAWGYFDKKFLELKCKEIGEEIPFKGPFTNLSMLYTVMSKREKKVGMTGALSDLKIPLEGNHHSGKDDSFNTAMILKKMFWRK